MANKDSKASAKAPAAKAKVAKLAKKVDASKSLEELRVEVATLQADVLEHKRSHRQGELVNPHILTVKRKSIARYLTAIKAAEQSAKETK